MKRRLLLLYLALLVASHSYRLLALGPPPLAAGEQAMTTADGARLVYRVREAEDPQTVQELISPEVPPTILLIHGSPGSLQDFDAFAESLPPAAKVLIPDLPGFGASWARLGDYSAARHARDLLQLLDRTHTAEVHVVAFSMGGAVALELAHLAPQRIASLSMIGAIGVQELELFGDYHLNHAVHGAQLVAIDLATWLLPHFGALDRFPLNIAYARNFFDTDQRPYRTWLQAFEAPALIIHGEEDFLVPVAAAREHHRLLPQSELSLYPGSHFLLWTRPQEIAQRVGDFVAEVEAGEALRRAQAAPAAQAAALAPFDPSNIPPFNGPALLVAMLLLALATLVSEDLTCIATGLLVAQGRIALLPGALACFLGIFLGDMLLFLAGRHLGRPAIRRRPLRWMITPGSVERASQWFRRQGPWVIFISRFMPGLRLPTYFAAGVLRTRVSWFAFYFALAGLIWTPILVYLSSRLGEGMADVLARARAMGPLGLLALILLLGLAWKALLPLATWRGRRLWRGRWRRWTHWEYWPRWRLYGPLLPSLLMAARRAGGLRVVTAVNPAIEGGGLVGESKGALLAALDGPEVARGLALPAGGTERLGEVERWRQQQALAYPLVLKPDAGERGFGVAVVGDAAAAHRWLEAHPRPAVVQEHVDGLEFGVGWLHDPSGESEAAYPGSAAGCLISLALKAPPTLTGDGIHDLEHLILDHPRHVAMAATLLEANADRLFEIPAAGEEVLLSPLGTHSKGAAFLDRQSWRTPELTAAIRRLSARLPGFHLGRYDLRVPTVEDLQAGRHLKVLELNGLTGEPAHIYDPEHGVGYARRELRQLWQCAYRLGYQHHAAGTPLPSWRQLWQWYRRSR